MERPKILPPTLREKERYIVFEVVSESSIDYQDLSKAIWFSTTSFLGELGSAESQARLMKNLYNAKTQKGIIRCRHDRTEQVRAALTMVRKIGGKDSIIRVLGITGTIKSAKNKYLGFTDLKVFENQQD
jgi:ribonuclease P/MRP protein subunit POP5